MTETATAEHQAVGCASCPDPLVAGEPVCTCLIFHPCHPRCCTICRVMKRPSGQ